MVLINCNRNSKSAMVLDVFGDNEGNMFCVIHWQTQAEDREIEERKKHVGHCSNPADPPFPIPQQTLTVQNF